MGLRIRTNIASMNAQRHMTNSTGRLFETAQKLASGRRINKAADDAAGLAISENLRADIRSLEQAKRNAGDGISLVQTAEGALVETTSMLVRLKELSVQAASDTIGDRERGYLDREFVALKDEIDRIANTTEFNGRRLIVGDNDLPEELANEPETFPLEIQVGKDYFKEVDAKDERNPVNIIKINFEKINAFTHGEGSLELGKGEDGLRVNNKAGAQEAVSQIDTAIQQVASYRADLGAIQNRLGSSINNLGVQTENLSQAKSRVVDADYAKETAEYTATNILQQAGSSVLSQANQMPQVALSLVQGMS